MLGTAGTYGPMSVLAHTCWLSTTVPLVARVATRFGSIAVRSGMCVGVAPSFDAVTVAFDVSPTATVFGEQSLETRTAPCRLTNATGRCSWRGPFVCTRLTWPKYCPSFAPTAEMRMLRTCVAPGATVNELGFTVIATPRGP